MNIVTNICFAVLVRFSLLFRRCHSKQFAFALSLIVAAPATEVYATIIHMRCEYLESPIGIDAPSPRFTWQYTDDAKNKLFKQSTYQLLIATSKNALENGANVRLFWSSGWTNAGNSIAIYSGKDPLASHTKYYCKVIAKDASGKQTEISSIQSFETGKMSAEDWKAQWISDAHDKDYNPSPMFRKGFTAKGKVVKARLYISAVAYYKAWINGKEISRNELDPAYTHYDKRNLYVTHDVTKLVQSGGNAISVVLGNGFYNAGAPVATWDFEKAAWRNRPRFIAELIVTYADGSTATIATDESWKTTTGPYVQNNIYSGDTYDARKEISGWQSFAFKDAQWENAIKVTAPSSLLVAQAMPAIQTQKVIDPVAVKSFGDSVYVFDFGINLTGVCALNITGEEGTIVTLQHGELLQANGRVEMRPLDIYYKPLPGLAFQTDVYILGKKAQSLPSPSFTYHGFRYVEVKSNKPLRLDKTNLRANFFHTNVTPAGSFSCSNELLNKIWSATKQSYLSNLQSIPTDCPQREKNGWTADAHIAVDLGLLNFDGITFYEKWINDIIDNQRTDGRISGIIPSAGWGYDDWIGPVWDAVMFIVPDAVYNYYGDQRSIEKIYATCEKYLSYLKTRENADGYVTYGIGDWVPYKTQTPTEFTSACYYYLDYKLMAKFATLTGRDATPYANKAAALKNIINQKYFNAAQGIYANGSQTSLALALYLDIVPDANKQQVAEQLFNNVRQNNYFLDFGVIGSKTVLRMLTKYGYADAAYKMASQKAAPSWGHWIEQGFTTLAETWTLSPEFRDASVNHVFLGDVSAWMCNALAGINYDEQQPGFKNIIIQPHFVEGLDWVKGSYKSIHGTIQSEWKRSGNKVLLTVTIPQNTTATILNGDKAIPVQPGEHQFTF
jgi:alpha-L-rhamnosidase